MVSLNFKNLTGLTPIVTIVLLFLLVVSSFGGLYTFYTLMGKNIQEETFESYKSLATDCIQIESVYSNKILVKNCGDGIINNNTVKIFINGHESNIVVYDEIGKGESGEIEFEILNDECFSTTEYEIKIKTPLGDVVEYKGKYPVDFDNDGIKERCVNGYLSELSIDNMRSYYLYKGVPTLFYSRWSWYPLIVDFSITYKRIITEEVVGYVEDPLKRGDVDFKIIKCENSNDYYTCTPVSVGDTGNCNDGIVKNYGDLEHNRLKFYWDDHYKDCSTKNLMVIRTRNPFSLGSNRIRVIFSNLELSGVGKHFLCVRYKEQSFYKEETPEQCIGFVNTRATLTGTKISNSNKNFGDTLSYSISTTIDYFNDKPDFVDGRRCRVYLWDYFHNPASDEGVSFAFRRHSSWGKRWSYFGFFASSRASGKEYTRINVAFDLSDVSCKVEHIYDNKCGWIWGVSWKYKEKTFSCQKVSNNKWEWKNEPCDKKKECDEFNHTGLPGEVFNMSLYMDDGSSSWRDIRTYVWCSDSTVFGDPTRKYKIKVNNVDRFWVNDMDYSVEKYYEESMLPHIEENYVSSNNAGDFSCNLRLNFCGKARYFAEVWDWPFWYGSFWSGSWNTRNNGDYVCVGGSSCPKSGC